MIFELVYCTAGISGHINPAVTFGLFLARKLSLTGAIFYIVMQCLGAICGAGVVKGFQQGLYMGNGGGANVVASGYTKGDGLGAEIAGTFILVYAVFSATDAKRNARDSHVPILAPLPIGFAVSTQPGALALPSSTTRTMPGMTITRFAVNRRASWLRSYFIKLQLNAPLGEISGHGCTQGVVDQISDPVKALVLHDPQSPAEGHVQKAMAYHANPTSSHVPSFQIEGSECQLQRLAFPENLARVVSL